MPFGIPTVNLNLGAELDIDTPSSTARDGVNEEARIEREVTRLVKVPFSIQALVGSTTYASLENASPPMGQQTSIRRVTMSIAYSIFAAMPAADAIKIYLFGDSGISLSQGGAYNQLSSAQMFWRWNVLPILQTWATKTVTLQYPEKAILVVENTSGPQLNLAGQLQIEVEPINGPMTPPEGYL